tara:strand:+ start:2195 stop:2635 length:441 start_codon:yes stop_codon:yes gene_type:complete
MEVEVKTKQLCQFLEAAENQAIDFALYVYLCGGSDFVSHESSYSVELDKSVHSYQFSKFYIEEEFSNRLPYFVSYIPGHSYLLYENGEEVVIWACFTEESSRGKGYIKHLLQDLKKNYQDKKINIDTFSEILLRYSRDYGFEIFAR